MTAYPSNSPNSATSSKGEVGDCNVCGQAGHGIHFGVVSCRACAAFFRRTVVLDRKYACRKAEGRCEISKEERYTCRQCRYKKCIRLGMTPENVQLNRDVLHTKTKKGKTKNINGDVEMDIDVPSTSTSIDSPYDDCKARSSSSSSDTTTPNISSPPVNEMINGVKMMPSRGRFKVSLSILYTDAAPVFKTFNPRVAIPYIQGENLLFRLEAALQRMRMHQQRDLEVHGSMSLDFLTPIWRENHRKMAEWLMFIDEFHGIPFKEKMVFLRKAGKPFMRMERHQMSIELFGERLFTDKICAMSDTIGVNFDRVMFDTSQISDYDPSYVKSLMHPHIDEIYEKVTRPLYNMKLTNMEVTYMLCQIFFHVEALPVSDNIQSLSIEVRNRISNDIHDYYINVLGQPNYADRLINIMTICHTFESIHQKREKVIELAKIFDVIRFDVCEDDDDFDDDEEMLQDHSVVRNM